MAIIHARAPDAVAEYVEEWADAVGAPTEDVAGDCIAQIVEDEGKDAAAQVGLVDVEFDFEHTADDNPRMSTDDDSDVATLHDYRRQVPSSWCVTLRIPDDTVTAQKAYGGHPIFHAAVDVVARTEVGENGSVDRQDVDGILRRDHGVKFDIPVSLLTGVGHDPEDTADALTDALSAVHEDDFDAFGGGVWS